ncbi:MAG: Gfo/Idh/MocA family oxidoreductase [Planctomycetaceae bacterium]
MSRQTRRSFLKSAAATAAASSVFPLFTIAGTKASGQVLGANDAIRLAVLGMGVRGPQHIDMFTRQKGVKIVAVCDPDQKRIDARSGKVKEHLGSDPKTAQDPRPLIEDQNIDAITIAAPNHWHSLLGIWGCQAGKDVYCEKPCSHSVWEGAKLVEAARKYGKIVSHGTQQRSEARKLRRAQEIAEGKHGKLLVSRAFVFRGRGSIGFKNPATPPSHLNWDVFLGPAPQQPYHENIVHYNWHWFWDFGGGDMANNGIHSIDAARWMVPNGKLPRSVLCVGGRFGYKDQAETPNTQYVVFEYADGTLLTCEMRGLPTKSPQGPEQVFDENASVSPIEVTSPDDVKNPLADRGPGNIFENWIAAVRARDPKMLDAHIHEGHYSTIHCHLANISYRLGQEVPFDAKKNAFGDDKEAGETFGKLKEHLKDNGVELSETTYRLGRKLVLDPETEMVENDKEANELFRREYRAPFVVPETV